MEIDYVKFNEGLGRWFTAEDYPTRHHTKTTANGVLWSWIWFFLFEHGTNPKGELEISSFWAMINTGIRTRKEYRRALWHREALGLIKIVTIQRVDYKDDIIIIL